MKKILIKIALPALVLFTATSCQDFLDTESPSKFVPEVVYENYDLTLRAVMGIYGSLPADATYSQDLAIMLPAGSDIEIRTHDNTVASVSDDSRSPSHFLANSANSKVARVWKALYECIERANNVVVGIEGSSIYADASSEYHADFKSMRAEAIALRAVCYMELTRHWGNVPFKLEPTQTDLSNAFLPRSETMDIYEYLVPELDACADDLPWHHATPERVTRGFARGLAARLALARAGWNYTTDLQWVAPRTDAAAWNAEAARQCRLVISGGQYSLERKFDDFFVKQCRREYSSNESLFEIGFQLSRSSEMGYSIGARFTSTSTKYGFTTQGTIATTPAYFYSFHPEDERRDASVVFYSYTNLGLEGNTSGVSRSIYTNLQNWLIDKWGIQRADEALWTATGQAGRKTGTGINFPMMRYSDILLMYAEADYQATGSLSPEAKEAFWEVRSRAIPTMTRAQFDAYLAGKDFMRAVKDERKWEFAGEALRKFDLMRWGDLVQAIQDMRAENGRIVTEWAYTFEFPVRSDGRTRAIPTMLYYKYDAAVQDFAYINIDYQLAAPPDASYLSSEWAYRNLHNSSSQETNRANTMNYWNLSSSGCVAVDGTPVLNGRPYQPVPATVVNDYNNPDLFDQEYGF